MAYTGLVKTTFMAGPDEAQSAADIYDLTKEVIITSKQDLTDVTAKSISAVENLIKTKDLNALLKKELPDVNKIAEQVKERLTTGGVDVKNCFKGFGDFSKLDFKIPDDLVDRITTTVNGVTSKIKGLVTSAGNSIGNAFEKVKNFKGFGDFKAITCATNSLTDGGFIADLMDKGGISGLISGLTNEGNKLGINNIFSSISNVVKDKDILLSAVKNIGPNAVKDINLLKDLASTSIGNEIKKIMPDVSKLSIAGFKIDTGIKQIDYPSVYNTTSQTLSSIDDVWNRINRNGTDTINGSFLTGLKTPDFHNVLTSSVLSNIFTIAKPVVNEPVIMPVFNSPDMFLMLTKGEPKQSVTSCLAKDFPTLPVNIDPPIVPGSVAYYANYSTDNKIIDSSMFTVEPIGLLNSNINDNKIVSQFNTLYINNSKIVTEFRSNSNGSVDVIVKKYNENTGLLMA